ncbi:MAG TPA: hypothetical protein DCE41_20925 [Cytophagales bacterium]|nr:hypothetical protein [Cytophagales bacterium]HAA23547.1 hypothetical protein [Cytophagales bacterium]HAP59557.1 hypothetical protein [Cytophagales bacterium]
MKKIIHFIQKSGVEDSQPDWFKRRLEILNFVGIFTGLGVGFGFSVLFLAVGYDTGVHLPAIGFFTSTPTFLYNRYLKAYKFAKLQTGSGPFILVSILLVNMAVQGREPYTAYYVVAFAFSLLPFLVWDPRESRMLIANLSFNALGLLMIPASVELFDFEPYIDMSTWDLTLSTTGVILYLSIVFSLIASYATLFLLVNFNYVAETKNQTLLQEAKENAKQIAENEKELQGNLTQIKKSQEEEKERQWINDGITELTSILRKTQSSQETFDEMVSFIVNYSASNQGALFETVRPDEMDYNKDVFLELRSTYAYGRKKFVKRQISEGEGLVGQVFLEKEPFYMTEVPEKYVNITSGLGEARPRAVFIAPLIDNDEVEGILELASFKVFGSREKEFLKQSTEIIAAHIRNTRVNERTRLLLEQSQQQAEEMKAQEEEMRQNAEEMQATQEEMHRKEREYLQRIQHLESQLESVQQPQG